jgi:DNA-binding MarR family transcriptional regulator
VPGIAFVPPALLALREWYPLDFGAPSLPRAAGSGLPSKRHRRFQRVKGTRDIVAARKKVSGPTKDKTEGAPPKLHDHIVARINRLADAMVRMSTHQIRRQWNLRNTDFRLLNVLDGGTSLSVNEIGRRALLDQAWISRTLTKLEAVKLVERHDDPRDSRRSLIRLSRKGRDLLEEFRPYAQWSERLLLKDVDERTLKRLLDRLETNTEALLDAFETAPWVKQKRP